MDIRSSYFFPCFYRVKLLFFFLECDEFFWQTTVCFMGLISWRSNQAACQSQSVHSRCFCDSEFLEEEEDAATIGFCGTICLHGYHLSVQSVPHLTCCSPLKWCRQKKYSFTKVTWLSSVTRCCCNDCHDDETLWMMSQCSCSVAFFIPRSVVLILFLQF